MANFSQRDEQEIVKRIIGLLAMQDPDPVLTFQEIYKHFKPAFNKKQKLHVVLRKYPGHFQYFEDERKECCIRLLTHLSICDLHASKNHPCPGTIPFCSGLHVCKFYLLSGNCKFNPCKFGHDLTTAHNMTILGENLVSGLPVNLINKLVHKSRSRSSSLLPKVCKFYNVQNNACRKGDRCPHLHLCSHFLNNDCKFGHNCIRSHNMADPKVKDILEKHGINTKRSVKEVLLELRKMFLEGSDDESVQSGPAEQPRP